MATKSSIIFHILVQNPDILVHISVLSGLSSLPAAWYPMLDSYFSLLNAYIWVVPRSPQLANLSSLLSTCSSLLAACWSLVAAYRSLLAPRLTLNYQLRLGLLLLIACYTSTFTPVAFFAAYIHRLLFASQYVLYAASFLLLTTCDSLSSILAIRFLLLAVWFFSLVAQPLPLKTIAQ